MRDFCTDFSPAVFGIIELSKQKPQIKKVCKKIHLTTTVNFERTLIPLRMKKLTIWQRRKSLRLNDLKRLHIELIWNRLRSFNLGSLASLNYKLFFHRRGYTICWDKQHKSPPVFQELLRATWN